jgi:hypothetical protein
MSMHSGQIKLCLNKKGQKYVSKFKFLFLKSKLFKNILSFFQYLTDVVGRLGVV